MKHFYTFTTILILALSVSTSARENVCSDITFANKALSDMVGYCSSRSLSLRGLQFTRVSDSVLRSVMQACSENGCHGENANSDSCTAAYAKALSSSGTRWIESYSDKHNCEFSTSRLNALQRSGRISADVDENDPFKSCFYVTSQVIHPGNSSCGATPACNAVGFCKEGKYAGKSLSLSCPVSSENFCPTFRQCAEAETPSWFKTGNNKESINSNVKRTLKDLKQ